MTELFSDFESFEGKKDYYNCVAEGRLIVPNSVTNYKSKVYVLVNECSAFAAVSIAALVMKEGMRGGNRMRDPYRVSSYGGREICRDSFAAFVNQDKNAID